MLMAFTALVTLDGHAALTIDAPDGHELLGCRITDFVAAPCQILTRIVQCDHRRFVDDGCGASALRMVAHSKSKPGC